MSLGARQASTSGGYPGKDPLSLTAATTITVPNDSNIFLLTGTATVTSLEAMEILPGRLVTFIQDSGTTTFTNTNDTTTSGQMDLGGSNVALAASDVLQLVQRSGGYWQRVFSTNN